jgi:hypothetical protein
MICGLLKVRITIRPALLPLVLLAGLIPCRATSWMAKFAFRAEVVK